MVGDVVVYGGGDVVVFHHRCCSGTAPKIAGGASNLECRSLCSAGQGERRSLSAIVALYGRKTVAQGRVNPSLSLSLSAIVALYGRYGRPTVVI